MSTATGTKTRKGMLALLAILTALIVGGGVLASKAFAEGEPNVVPITLGTEFESGLDLDNMISTNDFSAVGDATSLGLTSNVWVKGGGKDLLVDYKAATSEDGGGDYNTYSKFSSGTKVIQQIFESGKNLRGSARIDVAGVLIDGLNQADYVKAAQDAIKTAKENNASNLQQDRDNLNNKTQVQTWLDSRTDIPDAIKNTVNGFLGGSLRKLMKDPYAGGHYLAEDAAGNMYALEDKFSSTLFRVELAGGSTNFYNLNDGSNTRDKSGFTGYNLTKDALSNADGDNVIDGAGLTEYEYDKREDKCIRLAAVTAKAEEATKNATINVVWPYIGTYHGRKVGMKLAISNIDYELDARNARAVLNGSFSDNLLTPAFQIAGLPQFGIWQHNVNSADYDVKLFYVGEDEEGNEIKDTEHYITDMQDVYFTYSSLSTYNRGAYDFRMVNNVDADGNTVPNQISAGTAGSSYDRSREGGGAWYVNEAVKPISPIKNAYVTELTNVAQGIYEEREQIDGKKIKGNWVTQTKPSQEVTGSALKYVYNCEANTATLTQLEEDGYYYGFGWEANDNQKATSYGGNDDKVGVDGFTRQSVTLQFESVDDMKFNMNTTTNETWFAIYPQGMTYNKPDDPTKAMIAQVQKNVYDNDQTSAKENMVRAGEEVEIIVAQRVNELNANALIKYDSFSLSDSVPDTMEILDYYVKTDGEFNVTDPANKKGWIDYNGERALAGKNTADADIGTFSEDGNRITFTFNSKFVNPSRFGANSNDRKAMPYKGESYYLIIKAKVKETTNLGTITNKGESKIGETTRETQESSIEVVDESAFQTKVQIADRTKPLTFEVIKTVPGDATQITLTDNIDACFELDAAPVLYYLDKDEDGNEIKKYVSATTYQGEPYDSSQTYTSDVPALVKFDSNAAPENVTYHSNQAVSVTIANGSTKADKIIQNELAGKTLHLSLRVKIKNSVDDAVLLSEHGDNDADIPNVAKIKVDDKPETSNQVDVELVSDLRIEKATTDSNSDKDFEFTVGLTNKDDQPLDDTFYYNIYKWKGAKELPIYVATIEGVQKDELGYVQRNAELRKNTNTNKYILLFNGEYYRAEANDAGVSTWTKVPSTENLSYFVNNWNNAPFEVVANTQITGINGIDIPADADTTVPGTGAKTEYVLGDDDKYYKVDGEGNVAEDPAEPQPDPKALVENDQPMKSGDTILVKGGQWAIIKGLPVGTKYEIKEKPAPGYTNTAADGSDENSTIVVDDDIDKVVGQIHTNEHARTRFVNQPTDEPQKRVTDNNETLVTAATLERDTEEFTYTITQKLGKDAAKVTMTDDLDKVLELAGENGDITVVDETGAEVAFTPEIGTWRGYNAPVEDLEAKSIEIETLKQNNEVYYVKATDGSYYTRAKNGDGKWYKVEEDKWTDLDGNEAVEGKDGSGASLAQYGDVVNVIDYGEIIPIAEANGTKVTVTIPDNANNISVAANKTITITFKAKIKANADLSEYVDTTNKINVPNEATVTINNDPKITNKVTVTPPTPEPEKKVGVAEDLSDQAKYGTKYDEKQYDDIEKEADEIGTLELTGRDQVFTYTVSNKIPVSAKTVVFSDELEVVLEVAQINGDYDVEFMDEQGTMITDALIDVKGDRIVTATIADATAYRGQTLTLAIKAKIKDGVTDSELIRNYGSTDIPNKATVKFDDSPALTTNTVTVTPPDAPEKFVEGVQDANDSTDKIDPVQLDARDQEFEYKVTQVIPENAVNVVFSDTIEDVLKFVEGSATFSVDGVTPAINGQTITATIDDATSLAGKKVELTFKARIKDGVSDTELLAKYGQTTNIPNKATVTIDNHPQTTNEVLVTPPPAPEKHVNNEVHAVLANKNEVFTYTVDFYVPEGAETVDFTDTVNDVLVPVVVDPATGQASSANVTATVKGGGLDTTKPFNGKTIAFTLGGGELDAVKGANVTVTFKAMFDQEKVANLETMTADEIKTALNYEDVDDNKGVATNIQGTHTGTPNTAELRIKPGNTPYTTSNTVTVTPPSDEPGELDVTKTLKPEDEEAGLTDEEKAVQFGFEVTLRDRNEQPVDALTLIKDPAEDGLQVQVVNAEGAVVDDADIQIADKITFKLRHGEVAKITGVPGQYPYAIVETATEGYEVDTSFNSTGAITSGVTTTAPFVNKSTYVAPGELDVTKIIAGLENVPVEYRGAEFTYEVELSGITAENVEELGVTIQLPGKEERPVTAADFENGKIVFKLKDKETAKIKNIPAQTTATTTYKVDEQDHILFENTHKTNDVGTIMSDSTVTAVFINEFNQPPTDPQKKVNGKDHEDLVSKDTPFTYTVSQFVPAGAETFQFTDELNGQLEYASDATVTIEDATAGVIKTVEKPEGQKLEFSLTADELKKVVGHVVTVTWQAQYKADATDETIEGSYVNVNAEGQEITDNTEDKTVAHTGTPNQATTKTGNHEASTNVVTVTAPPDVDEPEKKVEGEESVKLEGREDTFTYSVSQAIPETLNLKSIVFSDTIENVLEFIPASNANAKVVDAEGANVAIDVAINGQTITATPKSLDGLSGKTLTFSFDAKIKADVTDDMLRAAGYVNNSIPNKATVTVNNSPLGTNEVFVTPPSEEEVPEKLILADHEEQAGDEAHKGTSVLDARDEQFTYTVNQKVPTGAYYLEFTDKLEEVLQVVNGTATVTVEGDPVEGANVTVTEQDGRAVVTATVGTNEAPAEGDSPIKDLEGKTVSLTFKAQLKADVTDEELFGKYVENSLSVPNEATVKVNDNPLNTNKVFVTPPPEEPESPEKFVEGVKAGTDEAATEDPYKLAKRLDKFTYTVDQKVPVNATNLTFVDTLEKVLVLNWDPETGDTIMPKLVDENGNEITEAAITVKGQRVTAVLSDAAKLLELTNKKVTLVIEARLAANVTDAELVAAYGPEREIPNDAIVIIGNNSETTNEVKVVPPEEPKDPEKLINDQKNPVELSNREETFVYTVTQLIPENASVVVFEDELAEELEVVKEPVVLAKATYDITCEEVTDPDTGAAYYRVVARTEDATKDHGEEVSLLIVAKIREGVSDKQLVEKYGSTYVPNDAYVEIDNMGKMTNEVLVTPPTPKDEPEKKVNGEDLLKLEQAEGQSVEEARAQKFTYTVSQVVPATAVKLEFEDTLVDELQFADESATAGATLTTDDGTEIAGTITVDGQKLTVVVDDEAELAKALEKTVTLTFEAKIRSGVTDGQLIAKYGTTAIPNNAKVAINGNPKSSNEVKVIPPDTPGEDPKKTVGKDAENQSTDTLKLDKRTDVFTYQVTQKVLDEAVAVTFEDTIEPVLEFVGEPTLTDEEGKAVELTEEGFVISGGRTITAVVKDTEAQGTAGEEGYVPANSVAAGKTITLTFQAKIKAGVTDAELIRNYGEACEIPNKAIVSMNNNPKVTNEVLVTPPPTVIEEPKKEVTPEGDGIDVDGKHIEAKLMNRFETFTYTVSQVIPNGAVNVQFDDVLEGVLETRKEFVTLTVDGQSVEGAQISVRNNRIVFATVADASAYAEKTMVLTIKAKIRNNVTDAALIALYGEKRQIPNEATVTIDGSGKSTNEVKVTPPEEPKDPEKLINDQKEIVTLADRGEEFTYTVKQLIPENAKTVTITDTIENELEFVDGSATFMVDGKAVEGVTPAINAKTITVEIDDVQGKQLGKKEAVLEFKAVIGADVTDQQLLDRATSDKYAKSYADTTIIPNKAEVKFDFENDPRSTNTVEVTPPPVPSDEPEKKVNGKDALKLEQAEGQTIEEARAQTFTYTVSQKVPAGCVKLEFEDTLEDVLEIVDTPKLSTGAAATVVGQKVTATVTDKEVLKEGEVVTLTIEARIGKDVKDSDLIAKYGTTTIPNKAKVSINGNPKSTNEVKVTPPDEPGDKPEKKVNGEEQVKLTNRTEQFTYTVTQKLPAELTKVEFSDKVESVLVIDAESAQVTGGEAEYVIAVNGQTITATAEDASADAGKEITLTFKANLKPGTTDEQLIALYGESMDIPNTAIVTIDATPRVTNEVTVTPPPSEREEPKKEVTPDGEGTVDGKKVDAKLMNRAETFTYTISQVIPAGAVNVQFDDVLVDVLEVVGTPTVTVDSEPVASAQVSVRSKGRVVAATVADATAYADRTMVLTIKAKIKDDVEDKTLIALYGEERQIPNEATVTIDGDGKSTNEVVVTPPEEPKDPEKLISGQKELVTLADRGEEFTYTVKQLIPENAKTVTITDTIENELVFADAGKVEGATAKISISGKTITAEIADVTAARGQEVTLTFKATIDPAVTDAQLLAREGAYKNTTVIPNKAEVKFDFEDDPRSTNTVEVTPPPTPSDEPEKKVGNTPEDQSVEILELEDRTNPFTYTVSQKIPAGAVNVVFEDTLEDVLVFNGVPKLTLSNGTVIAEGPNADYFAIDGQTITATIADATEYADDTITLTFMAKIRDDVTDKQLIEKYKSTVVPNKATVKINGNPRATNEVKVTPPPTPGDKPEKKVNGAEHADLAAKYQTFEYTVTQKLPEDAEKVEFSDTVESILEIVGTPAVTGGEGQYEITVSEDGRTVKAVCVDAKADANKEITLTFEAKIRKGTTEDQIAAFADRKVPNKAIVMVNDQPKLTNEVTVTPPTPNEEEPEKKVNGEQKATLADRDQEFTYTVSQKIPDGAVNVVFEDKLENVLQVVGEPAIDAAGATVQVQGQTVTATIADATELAGKTVTLTIKAKIKDKISDETLIALYGSTNVPNKATVTIDGNGKVTNEVLVTPPALVGSVRVEHITVDGKVLKDWKDVQKDVPAGTDYTTSQETFPGYEFVKMDPESAAAEGIVIANTTLDVIYVYKPIESEPEKKVNDQKELLKLAERADEFVYTVSQVVPGGAVNMVFTDVLEPVLVPVECTFNGGVEPAYDKETNTVTATVADATAYAGQTLTLTIKAKLAEGVTDAELVKAYGTTIVPNKATVNIDGTDKVTNEVLVTPPPEPGEPESPVKKVGNTAEDQNTGLLELENRDNPFTYTVSQKIPAGAVNVVFEDTLEDVLSFVGTPKLTLSNGTLIAEGPQPEGSNVTFATKDQKLTATIADATEYADDTITLTFMAKIADGVTDEQLVEKYTTKMLVPNKATVAIDGNPRVTNEVLVTPPPTPPTPPVGSVIVKYITEDGKVLEGWTDVVRDVPAGTDYTTTQKEFDGYEFVKMGEDSADTSGKSIAPGRLEVVYVYKPVPVGDVTVEHVTVDGKVLKPKADVLKGVPAGTDYATSQETFPGYELVKVNDAEGFAEASGKTIAPGTLDVQYIYKPIETTPVKKVNGGERAALTLATDPFTYTVERVIPGGAQKIEITDTIEDVLEFWGTPQINVEGVTPTIAGQTITVTIDDASKLAGKTVTLTFQARIKNGVKETDLIAKYGANIDIPNVANFAIDDEPAMTNEVFVNPPTGFETVERDKKPTPEDPKKEKEEENVTPTPQQNTPKTTTTTTTTPKASTATVTTPKSSTTAKTADEAGMLVLGLMATAVLAAGAGLLAARRRKED